MWRLSVSTLPQHLIFSFIFYPTFPLVYFVQWCYQKVLCSWMTPSHFTAVALLILEWVWSVSLSTLNPFVKEPHSSLWEGWTVPSSIKPLTSPHIIQLLPGPSPLSTVITGLFIQRSTLMCYDYFLPYLSPLMEWPFLCSSSYFLCPVQCSVLEAFKLLLGRIKGKWIVQEIIFVLLLWDTAGLLQIAI